MQQVTRQAFNKYMYTLIHSSYVNGKRKRFYKHIQSLQSDHYGIPSLHKDSHTHTGGHTKAKILNNHFYSEYFQRMMAAKHQSFLMIVFQVSLLLRSISLVYIKFSKTSILQKQPAQITSLLNS